MKILSSFTHPQVVADLYEFLSSAERKGRKFGTLGTIDFHSISYTLKKCWVISTQIWVKYGQTQMLG